VNKEAGNLIDCNLVKEISMKISMLLASVLFSATSALAVPASVLTDAKRVVDEDDFSTVGTYSMRIPSGDSSWEITLEEAVAGPTNLSIWYLDTPGCRPFGVNQVAVTTDAEDAEWQALSPVLFEGVYQYPTGEGFNKISLRLHNERFLPLNCDVVIRKVDGVLPEIKQVLAKIIKTRCAGEGNNEACDLDAQRIDDETRGVLDLLATDVENFGLAFDAIYKLEGYEVTNEEGVTNFQLISATRIMNR
jgi:hypothetical protein